MSGGKVVAWVCFQPPGSADPEIYFQPDCPYPEPTADTGIWQPLVLQSDLAAAIARAEALTKANIAYSQQLAALIGRAGNAEARAEAAEETARERFLQARDWAVIAGKNEARAEAAEAKLAAMEQDAREIYAQIPGLPVTPETCDAVTDVLTRFCLDFNEAIAAQQAEGE